MEIIFSKRAKVNQILVYKYACIQPCSICSLKEPICSKRFRYLKYIFLRSSSGGLTEFKKILIKKGKQKSYIDFNFLGSNQRIKFTIPKN